MSSLDKECNELKNAYDACFNTWFTEKFLQGNSKEPCPCEAMLKAYSECVKKAMRARNMDPEEYAAHWREMEEKSKNQTNSNQ